MRRDSVRANRIVALCERAEVPIVARSLEDWPDDILPEPDALGEVEHYRNLVALSASRMDYDRRALVCAGRCHGSRRHRGIVHRLLNDPTGGQLPRNPETPEGFSSVEKLSADLTGWFLSASSPIPFAYFDPILKYVVDGLARAAASLGESPAGMVERLTYQLAMLASAGTPYDSTPLWAGWGQNVDSLAEPVGQELSPGENCDEAGNDAHRVDPTTSELDEVIAERMADALRDPQIRIIDRILAASIEELALTSFSGRLALAQMSDVLAITWPEHHEYLDVLAALVGPFIYAAFSLTSEPITARVVPALLPEWSRQMLD